MKKSLQLAVILLAFLPAISFAQDKKNVWPEMKTFHSVMSSAFHPVEDGNYAPLKAKADSLFSTAQAWQRSPIPADYKPVETKAALKKLVIKCAAVNKGVQANLSDAQLKTLITEAHEVFHTIVGECRRTEE
jgi:hypothetical protein